MHWHLKILITSVFIEICVKYFNVYTSLIMAYVKVSVYRRVTDHKWELGKELRIMRSTFDKKYIRERKMTVPARNSIYPQISGQQNVRLSSCYVN